MKRSSAWAPVAAACAVGVALLIAVIVVPELLYPRLSKADLRDVATATEKIQLQQAQAQLANNARTTILQSLAGLVVLAGAVATWRQVHVNREGQITERFTRAVDQLGNANVDVRIGAMYALERISRNSEADRDAILFLLGSYIRNHTPWAVGAPGGPDHPSATVDMALPWMRNRHPDIQAAMGVLGRREPSRTDPVISLSRVDLRSAALRRTNLCGAQFRYSNLARAVLIDARLDRCDLTAADLRLARLDRASLRQGVLQRASLQGANLSGADLRHADLRGADLSGAILTDTVLVGALADGRTTWPAGFDADARSERGVVEDPTI
ncbi:MAG: pentapeptide repeat-containing protein [Catenulispora sp.]|nr:pentapeptide repeat-containing protein [Catenulispora sp.]